jgi:hypothetical protein
LSLVNIAAASLAGLALFVALGGASMPPLGRHDTVTNHVWALDYQHDATEDGRELKFLNVVDEFTARHEASALAEDLGGA